MEQNLSQNKNRIQIKHSFFWEMSILVVLSVFIVVLCLCIGRYDISMRDVFSFLIGKDISNGTVWNVLYHVRMPRLCVAYVIGIALAVSGAVYQTLFNNRLVSPGVLGVEAGACVGAGICILAGMSTLMVSMASFVLGVISALLAVVIQRMTRSVSTTTLVLAGIVVSALMNAIIGLIKYVADGENKLASITFWMLGDLSGAEMSDLSYLLPIVILCTMILFVMRWRLNALSLGEKEAASLGINYRTETVLVVMLATLLTSVSVSVSGTIGWVGLIIPNVARSIWGNDNKRIIPASVLLGGIFMVIVDTIARTVAPSEVPLGVITGFLGSITFVVILIKKGAEV